jgi:ABC-type transport system substrate-binding protein
MKRTYFLIPLLLCGCLAPDPGHRANTGEAAQSNAAIHETRAPVQIDPEIPINRTFGEAPILAEKVKKGELPPVSERLPENPLIVVPLDTIGQYGGVLRRALTGDIIQTAGVNKTLSENLMGFSRPMPDSIVHNLAENFEFLDEGRTAIFKIRKGIKWSDGVPFTVDDILFWYYDMTFDDNARPHNQPVPPSVWVVDGKPIDLKKIDDHTLEVSSSKPLGRVLHALCLDVIAQPKHHLSHLHPRYNSEATYEEFREQATNAMIIMKPGMPRLSAWVPRRMDSRSAHRL